MNPAELAAKSLDLARRADAKDTEIYVSRARSLVVEVSDLKVETLHQSTEAGVAFRVINDGRMGFAFTTDLSDSALDEAARSAVANSMATARDEFNRLPSPRGFEGMELGGKWAGVGMPEKIERAMEVERAAREYDPRVTKVRKATYTESEYEVLIRNTAGLDAGYGGTSFTTSILCVAEADGSSEMGWSYDFSRNYQGLKTKPVGREAAEKAVQLLGAKTIGTKRVPVVLDTFTAAEFLEAFSPAFSADAVQKGKSLFAGKVGQEVASRVVRIIDNGRLPEGIASAPVDDEGVPTQETVLVDGGTLRGYLHNTYTSAKDGVASTGNGMRSSFRSTPEVRPSNFFIGNGTVSRDELLAGVEDGFYVTSVMGMHTANPISGDFSVGASGLWIEKGRLGRPVRGVAIAGNFIELLKAVDAVADDLRFSGSTGSPTVRISRMTVSGD